MFKANRVGTPWIKQLAATSSVVAWTPILPGNAQQSWFANAINGTPVTDFGETNFSWTGAAVTITNGTRLTLGQQITVQEPLAGDAVGLELEGTIIGNLPKRCTITPIFGKINAAVALFATATFSQQVTQIGDPKTLFDATTLQYWGHSFKTQLILNATSVAGTYMQGFQINNNNGADFALDSFNVNFAVRQFNDLQQVSYRDPLR